MMHWHSWPFSDFYGMSNQLPWPSKPKPKRQEGRRCRGHLSTTSLSTRCTFLTALLSAQAKLETPVPTFFLILSPPCTCPLETCRCRWLSLVFCLTPPKKKPLKMSTKCSKVAKLSLNISHLLSHSHRHSPSLSVARLAVSFMATHLNDFS